MNEKTRAVNDSARSQRSTGKTFYLRSDALDTPEMSGISDVALRLWFGAMAYCHKFETTAGVFPAGRIGIVCLKPKAAAAAVAELTARGLFASHARGHRVVHFGVWSKSRAPSGQGRGSKRPLRPSDRFEVLKRDGFACRYCGRKAPEVTLHVDHVVPRAKGGSDDPSNLVAACSACNQGKGVKSLGGAVS